VISNLDRICQELSTYHQSFGDLERLLGHDEVWIASIFYGQNSISIEEAQKLAEILGFGTEVAIAELVLWDLGDRYTGFLID
jgi:cyanate lyase